MMPAFFCSNPQNTAKILSTLQGKQNANSERSVK